MNKRSKKNLSFLLIALAVTVIVLLANPKKIREEYFEGSKTETIEDALPEQETIKKPEMPSSHLLAVPFQSQAPNRNWAQPYQDGCEEASIVMVKYFYQDKLLDTPAMKSEIDQSVAWQMSNFGGHYDLDAIRTLKLAEDYFGLSGEVIKEYSLEDIKHYIFLGAPVIVPTAGRLLGNPGYTAPGPVYHMIVIIGYDDDRGVFITNDPGVNSGAKFEFKYQTVLDAISGPKQDMAKELLILNK